MCFMAGATALNTFFSPRQPGISISSNVLQLLLAPCGQFLARFVPKWSVSVRGHSIPLNPGPWTYKEQMLSTLMFTVASGAGALSPHTLHSSADTLRRNLLRLSGPEVSIRGPI